MAGNQKESNQGRVPFLLFLDLPFHLFGLLSFFGSFRVSLSQTRPNLRPGPRSQVRSRSGGELGLADCQRGRVRGAQAPDRRLAFAFGWGRACLGEETSRVRRPLFRGGIFFGEASFPFFCFLKTGKPKGNPKDLCSAHFNIYSTKSGRVFLWCPFAISPKGTLQQGQTKMTRVFSKTGDGTLFTAAWWPGGRQSE